MAPRSIAFCGASNNYMRMGTAQLFNLIHGGFKGEIYPLHPKEEIVLGLKAYKSFKELPKVPDLVFIVLPTRLVIDFIQKAGEVGIQRAIIVSAGFSELGKEDLTKELQKTAEKYQIKFLGPNCIGIMNNNANINLTWFPIDSQKHKGGKISIVSQSGSWSCQIYPYAREMGIKLSKTISVGNSVNTDLVDCLEYFGEDPETQIIGLYIEGLKPGRGRYFAETCKKIIKTKPIVVLYTGGTKAGSRAGQSHTASLGGSYEIYSAVFRECGVTQATNIEEFLDFLHVFAVTPLPKGSRMAIHTLGGGPAVSFADASEKMGFTVPEFSQNLQQKLKDLGLPQTAITKNPVDLTFDMDLDRFYQQIPRLIIGSKEVDGVFVYGVFGTRLFEMIQAQAPEVEFFPIELLKGVLGEIIPAFVELIHQSDFPIIISSLMSRKDETISYLLDHDVAVFPSPFRAVKAMRVLFDYFNYIRRI
ncbi:MAG: acetate--CoA ligase family protein [Candidatus Hodarchaeota archaeon]